MLAYGSLDTKYKIYLFLQNYYKVLCVAMSFLRN